jgi:AraC family transcriptional regulator of adaptative response/methylated-DNA-[protein]-cysteine methyltransferase
VQAACGYLAAHVDRTVTLSELAAKVGSSPFHLQRTFRDLVGLSPLAYQQALRADRFRRDLRNGASVTRALYEAGYGSASRVYESGPTGPGMTPAAYRRGGAGADVRYVILSARLGRLLVAATPRGVCAVKLGDEARGLVDDLHREYPAARVSRGDATLARWARAIVRHLDDRPRPLDLPVDVQATAFQWQVWRALQRIPAGETRTYTEVARAIGRPSAVRAVARACASNPVCLVIPCHRVVAKGGGLGGYRWGVGRKEALLAGEAALSGTHKAPSGGHRARRPRQDRSGRPRRA